MIDEAEFVFTGESPISKNRVIIITKRYRNKLPYAMLELDGQCFDLCPKLCYGQDKETILSNMRRDIATLSSIVHPNIVKFVAGNADYNPETMTFPWIVLDYYPRNLARALDIYKDLSPAQGLRIALGLSSALAYLHDTPTGPIRHGSLTPAVVLLDQDNTVKLTGFQFPSLDDVKNTYYLSCSQRRSDNHMYSVCYSTLYDI